MNLPWPIQQGVPSTPINPLTVGPIIPFHVEHHPPSKLMRETLHAHLFRFVALRSGEGQGAWLPAVMPCRWSGLGMGERADWQDEDKGESVANSVATARNQ